MWRIADDHWDVWTFPHNPADASILSESEMPSTGSPSGFPMSSPATGPTRTCSPGAGWDRIPEWGEARQSRETQDEQRTEFTLWAIARSPLILGANLTRLDDFTRSLITNQDSALHEPEPHYTAIRSIPPACPGFEHARVWRATVNSHRCAHLRRVLRLLQSRRRPLTLQATWKELGLDGSKHQAQNVWTEATAKDSKDLT